MSLLQFTSLQTKNNTVITYYLTTYINVDFFSIHLYQCS